MDCRRKTYTVLFFLVLLGMTASVVFAYFIIKATDQAIVNTEDNALNILNDINTYFNNTAQELKNFATEDVREAAQSTASRLDRIEEDIAQPLQNYSISQIEKLEELSGKIDRSIDELGRAQVAMDAIVNDCKTINDSLNEVQKNLEQIRRDCSDPCNDLIVNGASMGTIQTQDLNDVPDNLNLNEEVNKAKEKTKDIKEKVKEATDSIVTDLKKGLHHFIQDFNSDSFMESVDGIQNVTKELGIPRAKTKVKEVFATIDDSSSYWKYGTAAVVSLLTVPLALLCLGLLCGCAGHKESRHPAERGGLSNCGGNTIMIAIYLLFFITGIPILVTTILFQLGGHFEVHLCSIFYEQDFKTYDKILNDFNITKELRGTIFEDFQPSHTFLQCQNDSSIYNALNLRRLFDLKELDFEAILKLKEELGKFQIDVSKSITFFPSSVFEAADKLINFPTSKLENGRAEIENEFLNRDKLLRWIDNLNSVRRDPNIKQTVKDEIDNVILKLKAMVVDLDKLEKERADLLKILVDGIALKDDARKMNATIYDVLNNISEKANNLKDRFCEDVISVGTGFVDNAKNKIGHCGPLFRTFDVARHTICRVLLGPINGFWFCLGWSLFFSIFAIAFGTKLSKHYQRMTDMKHTKWEDDLQPREYVPANDDKPFIPMKETSISPSYYNNQGYTQALVQPQGPSHYSPPPFNPGPRYLRAPQHYNFNQY